MNEKLKQKKSDGTTVTRWLIVCLLSILGSPINASADCPSPLNSSEIHFSDAVREFYEDMCRESDGVPHYELMYLVRAGVPQAGAAVMIVTAVDRQPRPGITGFDFKDSSIRLKF